MFTNFYQLTPVKQGELQMSHAKRTCSNDRKDGGEGNRGPGRGAHAAR
jgi:hypothetical protein